MLNLWNNKKRLFISVLFIFAIVTLTACGSNKWTGTYGGTSSGGNKVEIQIEKNGKVIYNENGKEFVGKWTENDNSLNFDFDGKVSIVSEPLIWTVSSDGQTGTVDSKNSTTWNPDTYEKR